MRISRSIVPRASCAAAAALASAFVPAAAAAHELDYRVPAGCPTRDELSARLAARAPEGRPARIEVRQDAQGFHGVVVLGEGEQRLERSIDGRSCEAVLEALILIIALDHDDADEPAPPPPSPPPDDSPAVLPAVDAPAREPRDTPRVAPTPRRDAPSSSLELAFGVGFSTTRLMAGFGLYGALLSSDIASKHRLAGVSWLRPSARAAFMRTLPAATGGTVVAEVQLTSASLDLCPIGFGDAPGFGVVVCAHGELGSLEVGAAGNDSSTRARLWSAAGGVLRARYVLTASEVLRPVLEMSTWLTAPLRRDRFHFDEEARITALPAVWTFAIGGGVVIP